jgi:tetratricopeptide (TPR) repeat protein
MGCFFLPKSLVLRVFLLSYLFALPFSFAATTDSPQDLLNAGRVDDAVRVLEQQIRTQPTADAYNFLCRAHFELDAWDAGIPACEKATALDQENGLYHLWLGRIYGEKADRIVFFKALGLAKKVHTEFESAVEFAPYNWEAHTDLAEFYLEAPGIVGGGEDKARAQADVLMRLNPAMAHWAQARMAEKHKDTAVAEKEYRAEIEVSHGGARGWVNLAGFYRRLNRLDEMESAIHSMESAPLDRPAALMDGAGLLLRTGRNIPTAIRLVRRYLNSPAEEWPAFKAHNMLGELLERQGDRDGAASEYRAALALAHNFKRAQDGLKTVSR